MDPLLASLAVLAVACLAGIAGLFFRLRARLRAEGAYHRAAAIHKFPQRLNLQQLEPFAWRKLSRGPQRAESFRALGFVDLGGFSVDELPGARLFVLQHPSSGLLGLVNEHEQLGTWSDVLTFPHGETQPILASSILRHGHFFLLPGSPKIHKHRATEQELANAVTTAAGRDAAALKLTAGEFARLYEEAFAEALDRRLLEPLDDSEFRRLQRDQCQPCRDALLTDEEFGRIRNQYPAVVANELRLVCVAQFIRETDLPASQWQEARGRILVIHERTPLSKLTERRIYGAYLTEALKGRLRRHHDCKSPRESFGELNAALPAWERYKKLGEVGRPVPADIYRAPIPRKTT
jgi:hypothetical protein